MNCRRLPGIRWALVALALVLVPAALPVRAQLLVRPVPVPAPVPVAPPLPVQSLAAAASSPTQLAAADKIDPALRDLMQANPQALLPVIVEMEHPVAPFVGAPNVDRALTALDLLRQSGISVAGLSLIDGAAGFANAAGINAVSLVPAVARIITTRR